MEKYIDKKTLCRRLSLSRATIDRLASRGEIEKVKVGRKSLFSESGVAALMERMRRRASATGRAS
jgi:excisionase family DNA binding protein